MRDYDSNYDTMSRDRYDRGRTYDRGGMFGWNDDSERPRYSDDRYENRDRRWLGDRDVRDAYGDSGERGVPRNETERLIASDKVEGTPVYGRDREELGSIHNFMVEKRSGKARYAVMKTSSGFLGLDERYYPLDWDELTYDTRLDGYHVDMSKDELKRRRSFDSSGRPTGIESSRDYDEERFRRDRGRYERSTW